jgi:hypothetical protein
VVRQVWNTPCIFTDPLDIWQFKIRLLRKKSKGWSLNVNSEIRKQKQELIKEFERLDIKQESHLQYKDKMNSILKIEVLSKIHRRSLKLGGVVI